VKNVDDTPDAPSSSSLLAERDTGDASIEISGTMDGHGAGERLLPLVAAINAVLLAGRGNTGGGADASRRQPPGFPQAIWTTRGEQGASFSDGPWAVAPVFQALMRPSFIATFHLQSPHPIFGRPEEQLQAFLAG
jgi:hypothetical protein